MDYGLWKGNPTCKIAQNKVQTVPPVFSVLLVVLGKGTCINFVLSPLGFLCSRLLQFVTLMDFPNGGHVFSPFQRSLMDPFTRSRLEEPGVFFCKSFLPTDGLHHPLTAPFFLAGGRKSWWLVQAFGPSKLSKSVSKLVSLKYYPGSPTHIVIVCFCSLSIHLEKGFIIIQKRNHRFYTGGKGF